MHPVLFTFGGHALTTWPLFALIGIWVAFFRLQWFFTTAGVSARQVALFYTGCVIVWFLGANGFQLLTVGDTPGPGGGVRFSGFVLYGGVIASVLFGIIWWRLACWHRKFQSAQLGDEASFALLWAIVFGRLGCAFYGCCYGTPSGSWPGTRLDFEHWDFMNRSFPMELKDVDLHPAPLYEAILVLVTALGIGRIGTRVPPGVKASLCWLSYAVVRFFLEFIRLDPRGEGWAGLSPSQWISLGVAALMAVLLFYYLVFQKTSQPAKTPATASRA